MTTEPISGRASVPAAEPACGVPRALELAASGEEPLSFDVVHNP
jgi:hypothetical protein